MDGIADMGGTPGWGPTRPPDRDEPLFAERWQGRAFALALLSQHLAGFNVDAFRHAIERLNRSAYLDQGYFGRWLNASELMLTDSAILAPGAVDARARNLRGEHAEEPPIPRPAKPDYAPTAPGALRPVDAPPAFTVGERVRAKNISPAGHTRLAGYVRGHTGTVQLIQPSALLPDTNAHFMGENPQHVYTVRFDSHELWGGGAEPFAVTIELYESYLEKTP
ncbi:nitrile hydratase subunit beta [Pseudonocardia alaniniphila]|uniref:Nitrile hydratase subunit beta n=1 Tax=Pseudonocardia alaniniphila TaxID=75291 RepID=A0ABS9T6S3_9PSEU|nr:nitrile hydratase subunit beta [Pseudonocardia alaniniphila]MCH6164123.1 nitrile hydratase subunit beta [Pseudonocardia alaniniphila]